MKDGKYEIVSSMLSPDGKSSNEIKIGWFQVVGGKITRITPTLMHGNKAPSLSELLRQYSNHAYYHVQKMQGL